MTSMKDLCEECLHERREHQSMGGCGHFEKDRLGFIRETCECLQFFEGHDSQERSPK